MSEVKVFVYIAMSLDGYLAGENDDISWLDAMDKEGEDYGYAEFSKNIDKYIVGRKTYDVVMKLTGAFPQTKQFECYVLSTTKTGKQDGVNFYNGSIVELVNKLKSKGGKHIYCDGGAQVLQEFMKHDLVDEYIISVIPTILGKGKKLFIGNTPQLNIKLIDSTSFETGLVQLHYKRIS